MSRVPKLPITVLIAAKDEATNIPRCLRALDRAERVVVIDSHSTDATRDLALAGGAEVIQFQYSGGYPKKRQWALENIPTESEWILLLDADEVVPAELWDEIDDAITGRQDCCAFLITKGFHFLGRRFRFGGFSHSAVILFRRGKAGFERLVEEETGFDMEVHERLIVGGKVGCLRTPLIHEDFKGLEAYISRHNKYSTWEARLRGRYLSTGQYGTRTISPSLFGNAQERRRALKLAVIRLPMEHWLWFAYHYVFRLGFLEGRAGLIACQIRSSYIAQVNAKIYELQRRTAGTTE